MKILLCCPHPLSHLRAGSNARVIEMARQLAPHFDVCVSAPSISEELEMNGVQFMAMNAREASARVSQFDFVISNGTCFPARMYARKSPRFIFDFYNPFLLEMLAGGQEYAAGEWKKSRHVPALIRFLLWRADLILCASPQQREFWLGAMYGAGALRPERVQRETKAEDLVRIVPFGLPDEEFPGQAKRVLKGVHPGIQESDKILLWGGGMWNWLDPLTLIRAMQHLASSHPQIKLYFMAAYSQESRHAAEPMTTQARELAAQCGLLNRTVFWGEEWVRYEERANYLAEADLAVCLSPESLENHFSYRTRLLDALWAGVPILCTRGGFVADWIEQHGCGVTVREGDESSVAEKIVTTLEPEAQARMRSRINACRQELSWNSCIQPLVEGIRKLELQPPKSASTWREYIKYKLMG